jgi:hypothetical protein
MSVFDLYGFGACSIEEAKDKVASALSLAFQKRDSLHYGEYFLSESPDGEFRVRDNEDPFGEGPVEPDFPDHKVLLFADYLAHPDEVRQAIQDRTIAKHLRRDVLPDHM